MKRLDKSPVEISFLRSEILYSISNLSWLEGDVLQTEDEHWKNIIQDVCDEGNMNRIAQILDLAYFEVVDMLYPYSKQCIERHGCETKDAAENEDVRYIIQLMLPDGFSVTTVGLLDKLVREYMVCRTLSDWMGITNPEMSAKWVAKTQDVEEKIRTCKNSRRKPVRIKMYPF